MPSSGVTISNTVIKLSDNSRDTGGVPAMIFGLDPMAGRGMYLRFIRDFQLQHVQIITCSGEGILIAGCTQIELNRFDYHCHQQTGTAVVLDRAETVFIKGCKLLENDLSSLSPRYQTKSLRNKSGIYFFTTP